MASLHLYFAQLDWAVLELTQYREKIKFSELGYHILISLYSVNIYNLDTTPNRLHAYSYYSITKK